jgi:hypothetical protein
VAWAIRSAIAARTHGGEAADAQSARDAIGTRLREHVEAGTIELRHRLRHPGPHRRELPGRGHRREQRDHPRNRAPTLLLATGHEQARSVVAALAGDWVAARDVQRDLPEAGVCVTAGSPLDL